MTILTGNGPSFERLAGITIPGLHGYCSDRGASLDRCSFDESKEITQQIVRFVVSRSASIPVLWTDSDCVWLRADIDLMTMVDGDITFSQDWYGICLGMFSVNTEKGMEFLRSVLNLGLLTNEANKTVGGADKGLQNSVKYLLKAFTPITYGKFPMHIVSNHDFKAEYPVVHHIWSQCTGIKSAESIAIEILNETRSHRV